MPKLSATVPLIHDGCLIDNAQFGGWCEVGQGSRIINTTFHDYAYCDRLADIANTTVGKFANIAAMTRIGPTDHPYAQASLHHFLYRSSYYWDDAADDPAFFTARAARRTVIGPDTWVGHGAINCIDESRNAFAVLDIRAAVRVVPGDGGDFAIGAVVDHVSIHPALCAR